MTEYEVYATRWDDPHIVEELLPARDLSFSMPLSDHGDASFSATVEPGKSVWRAAVGLPLSGLLIARDGQPVWSGWISAERQTGPRTFQFSALEWGSFFTRCPAPSKSYSVINDHAIILDLISGAQAVPGQDVKVTMTATQGAQASSLDIPSTDTRDVMALVKEVADADGGPEWYFGTTGTLANPVRRLVLGDRLGATSPVDVLHYVEDTPDWQTADSTPGVVLLSDVFRAGTVAPPLGRRGGNVLALARGRDIARSATAAIGIGDGSGAAQLRANVEASTLLARGWPRLTATYQHNNVGTSALLTRLTRGDLAAVAGISTQYTLATFDGDPDWTQIARGSTMRAILDTDIYAGSRPLTIESRVLNTTVNVDDDGGPAQVTWDIAETLEAS